MTSPLPYTTDTTVGEHCFLPVEEHKLADKEHGAWHNCCAGDFFPFGALLRERLPLGLVVFCLFQLVRYFHVAQ